MMMMELKSEYMASRRSKKTRRFEIEWNISDPGLC